MEGLVGRIEAVAPLNEMLCLRRGRVFKSEFNANDDGECRSGKDIGVSHQIKS